MKSIWITALPEAKAKADVWLILADDTEFAKPSVRHGLSMMAATMRQTKAAGCTEVETGARNIDFILRSTIMPLISQEILSRMSSGAQPSAVTLDVDADGGFAVCFTDVLPA